MSWVQGFLSMAGADWAGTTVKNMGVQNWRPKMDLLYGIDIESAAAWLNSYCNKHPLNNLDSAALSLAETLMDRAAKRGR